MAMAMAWEREGAARRSLTVVDVSQSIANSHSPHATAALSLLSGCVSLHGTHLTATPPIYIHTHTHTAPFYYMLQYEQALEEVYIVPLPRLELLSRHMRKGMLTRDSFSETETDLDPFDNICFVLSTGRCGSTLTSKILAEPPEYVLSVVVAHLVLVLVHPPGMSMLTCSDCWQMEQMPESLGARRVHQLAAVWRCR